MTWFALAAFVSLVNSDASKLMVEVLRIFVSGKCARFNIMSILLPILKLRLRTCTYICCFILHQKQYTCVYAHKHFFYYFFRRCPTISSHGGGTAIQGLRRLIDRREGWRGGSVLNEHAVFFFYSILLFMFQYHSWLHCTVLYECMMG